MRIRVLSAAVLVAGAGSLTVACHTLGVADRAEATRPLWAPARLPGEPDLRVRIGAGIERAAFFSAGGVTVTPVPPAGQTAAEPMRFTSAVTVERRGGEWLIGDDGGRRALSEEFVLEVRPEPLAAEPAALLEMNGAPYPGLITLRSRSDLGEAAIDAVEVVAIEIYLPGVVAKEMYRGWPEEAYKMQAVAARTYALHERARAVVSGAAFDVESTTADQVYGGLTDNEPAIRAVRDTAGWVVAFEGQLLRTYYSSTCGGRPASARATWPSGAGMEFNLAGPIQAHAREHACQPSPLYVWTVRRPADEALARLRAYGERQGLLIRQIAGLARIEPMDPGPLGRPTKYKFIEPGGRWFELSAEDARRALNQPVEGLPAIERATRVHSGDFEGEVAGGVLTVRGRGFGHGVGMCQFCAKGFADRGAIWPDMVRVFYPGAEPARAY